MKIKLFFALFFSVYSNSDELVIFDGATLFSRDESVARKITGIGVSNGGFGIVLKSWAKWDTLSGTAESEFYQNFTDIEQEFENVIPKELIKRQKDEARAIRNEAGKIVPPLLAAVLNGNIPVSQIIHRLNGTNQKIAKTLEPTNLNQIMQVRKRVLALVKQCKDSGKRVLVLSGLHPEVCKQKREELFSDFGDDIIPGLDYDLNQLIHERGSDPKNCTFIGTRPRQTYPKSCGLQIINHQDGNPQLTINELKRRNFLQYKAAASSPQAASSSSASHT